MNQRRASYSMYTGQLIRKIVLQVGEGPAPRKCLAYHLELILELHYSHAFCPYTASMSFRGVLLIILFIGRSPSDNPPLGLSI